MAIEATPYTLIFHMPATEDRPAHPVTYDFEATPIFLSNLLEKGDRKYFPNKLRCNFVDANANLIVNTHLKGFEAIKIIARSVIILPNVKLGSYYMYIKASKFFASYGKLIFNELTKNVPKASIPGSYKAFRLPEGPAQLSVNASEECATDKWKKVMGFTASSDQHNDSKQVD